MATGANREWLISLAGQIKSKQRQLHFRVHRFNYQTNLCERQRKESDALASGEQKPWLVLLAISGDFTLLVCWCVFVWYSKRPLLYICFIFVLIRIQSKFWLKPHSWYERSFSWSSRKFNSSIFIIISIRSSSNNISISSKSIIFKLDLTSYF